MTTATKPKYDTHWLQRTAVPTVSVKRAAGVLGIDSRTVYHAIAMGDIPAIRLPGKTVIPRNVLLELLHLEDLSGDSSA